MLKSRNPSLKILLSVGGWGADHFSDAALTESSRRVFAKSAVELLERHHLDGVDIDWEYPGQPGPGIRFRAEDKQNFTLLLRTLREELDRSNAPRGGGGNRYLLTIASSGGEYFRHTEMERLHRHVDWINIMAYDFAGSWTSTTGHHAALFASDGPSAAAFVEQHLRAGIPTKKIVLGVPFYGRGWTGVRAENRGLQQPYATAVEVPWSRLPQEGFIRHWDDDAKAPLLWSATEQMFISYEDHQSLAQKAQFVREKGLGGFMFWEYSHDPNEELLDALVQGVGGKTSIKVKSTQ